MQKLSPTLYQVISTDYLAQNFFVMIFGGWAIYFIDALFTGGYTTFLLILAALCTPIGLGTFFWRYHLITSTFAEGSEVTGKVIEIQTVSTGRRRRDYIIHYEYSHQGQVYRSHNRVKATRAARSLRQGQSAALLVNASKPHVAFIKDLYIEFL